MKVLHPRHLPTKLPILTTAVIYLVMDKFHPAGWVWGVVITLLVIYWIASIVALGRDKFVSPTELLEDSKKPSLLELIQNKNK